MKVLNITYEVIHQGERSVFVSLKIRMPDLRSGRILMYNQHRGNQFLFHSLSVCLSLSLVSQMVLACLGGELWVVVGI